VKANPSSPSTSDRVQLLGTERSGRPIGPGRIAQRDYEYVRLGTANVFCIVAPKTGRHLTHATSNRKARQFAGAIKRISDAYPKARRIHLILDNLSEHKLKSLPTHTATQRDAGSGVASSFTTRRSTGAG
jgi:hypothetical protein